MMNLYFKSMTPQNFALVALEIFLQLKKKIPVLYLHQYKAYNIHEVLLLIVITRVENPKHKDAP